MQQMKSEAGGRVEAVAVAIFFFFLNSRLSNLHVVQRIQIHHHTHSWWLFRNATITS